MKNLLKKTRLSALLMQFILVLIISGCFSRPELQVSAYSHHFPGDPYTGHVETEWTFQVWNSGDPSSLLKFKVIPQQSWIEVSPNAGLIRANGEHVDVLVKILRNDFPSVDQKSAPWFSTGEIKVVGGGIEKVITVTTVPNFYTEIFGAYYNRAFDLSTTTLVFVPDNSLSFYKQFIKKNVTTLPISSANLGQPVYFELGDPFPFSLSTKPVSFYGKSYDKVFVSSKGYVSFGSEGKEPITVGAHFAFPQISVLPIRISSPNEGGAYFLILPEKIVITWLDVVIKDNPTIVDGGPKRNSMQVEVLYNGEIRITYLDIDPKVSGIVGLSCGGGDGTKPPMEDFIVSDLTNAPEI
ncbi:MAG: hypothetical protein N3G21_10635 [Candidatus Hydrogenedentes bacterium]|nr:hypothetical protein [Candidatus Hydrogenedentota bacterium]